MMGRSHLLVHSALAVGGLALLDAVATSGVEGSPAVVAHPAGFLVEWVAVAARWSWDQLFPHQLVWWWLVPAALLFWLGSLLPDIDNQRSLLGKRVSIPLGPHRGITHSDWVLWGLFAASVLPQTRILVFLWLGALLHAELDGWSTAGRVRFWPLTAHKVVNVGSPPQPCVVRHRPRRFSYRTGGPSELVAVLLGVGLAVAMGAAAWAL